MIFGDPSKFAISWEIFPKWDTQRPRFYEGLFFVYVNGSIIPRDNIRSENVWFNLREFNNALKEHAKQKSNKIFSVDESVAYGELIDYSFGDDFSNWEYRADSSALNDCGWYLFLIKGGGEDILYAGLGDDFFASAVLDIDEFSSVVNDATECFFETYPSAVQKKFN